MAKAKIVTLNDASGNQLLPRTKACAVVLENGKSVETALAESVGGTNANVELDTALQGIRLTGDDGKDYILKGTVQELVNPATPTISSTTAYVTGNSASGNATTSVALSTTTSGATIHYTTNGEDPQTSSSTQTGSSATLTANLATPSTTVTVKARAKMNGLWSGLMTQYVSVKRRVPKPTISVGGTEYDASRTATFTCTNAAATVHYTTDGTNPTTSSQQGTSTSLTATTAANRVKAFAVLSGWENSEVATYGSAVTVGSPRIYYGMSSRTSLNALDLTGGSALSQKSAKALTLTVTNDSADKYFFLVVPNESGYTQPASFAMSGYGFTPVEGTLTVGGKTYKTYRTADPQAVGSLTVTTA